MPFYDFPAMTALEDSQYFQDARINGAVKYETEGGLVITRPRFTRPAGRNIVTGFSLISNYHKDLFDKYFDAQYGGALSFRYLHPVTFELLTVRFDDVYTTAYQGVGSNSLWNITNIKLRTV